MVVVYKATQGMLEIHTGPSGLSRKKHKPLEEWCE